MRCTARVRDASGRVVFEFDDDIHEKGPTVVHRSDRTEPTEPPAAAAENRPPDDQAAAVEHHLPAFPVRAGDRLTTEAAVVHRPPDPDAPMATTHVGSVSDVAWRLLIGDYDPDARLNFRADGPTYGLQAAGAGLLLLVIGVVLSRRGRRPTADDGPPHAAAR